ncbi:MAG: oxidoreductase [Ornithinimicrobium sp.]|uniref:oxidoreductase n=1 Tax=Ornithinimicrobium sp. TaxID=1977084 RepID=UPI00185F08C8|nr:SDR family NAD(P)-dependent oxidoreductase [Actinomycetota bacterium]
MPSRWSTADIPDLRGSVAVVTGGNAGLGLATVRALAERGAQVVLASRKVERGKQSLATLRQGQGGVEVLQLDLADLGSVRDFAEQVGTRHTRLDLLINNAGIMMVEPGLTADGFEHQIGTNHLGHFALTGLLIDLISSTPGARVVTVSSLAHRWASLDPPRVEQVGPGYGKVQAYGRSKLANLLFAYDLQRRVTERGVPVSSLAAHPGSAGTGLADHLLNGPISGKLRGPLLALITQSPEAGALPTLRAATDPGALGGQFYGPDRMREQRGAPVVVTSSPASYDVRTGRALWARSEELTGVEYLSG